MLHAKTTQAIHMSSKNLKERCLWRNTGAEEYNIKMDTNKKYMDWIDLAQKMDEWRSLVNSVK